MNASLKTNYFVVIIRFVGKMSRVCLLCVIISVLHICSYGLAVWSHAVKDGVVPNMYDTNYTQIVSMQVVYETSNVDTTHPTTRSTETKKTTSAPFFSTRDTIAFVTAVIAACMLSVLLAYLFHFTNVCPGDDEEQPPYVNLNKLECV